MAKEPRELTSWEPFGMVTPLREAMNRLFEDSFISPARFEPMFGRGLPLDVFEADNEFIIDASLPGVKPEDLKVSATDDSLTIRATMKHETHDEQKGSYVRRERQDGEVVRSIAFATPIDPSKVNAHYEHGVLRVTAPKAEAARPRQIDVTVH
ncbi:MAG TPA: Hsp20/alpha crystallin family protein [Ktedonobacterales bacterium]|jgi:HSP20 family protein|nr:Hsp20/alpha crystallin family protein [Ktedonobacterales bacterium]